MDKKKLIFLGLIVGLVFLYFTSIPYVYCQEAWYHIRQGDKFFKNHQYSEAQWHYERATEFDPENGRAWNGLGNAYRALDENHDALEAYREAQKVAPWNPQIYIDMGRNYYDLDNYKEARKSLQRAKKIYLRRGDNEGANRVDEIIENLFRYH